MSKKKQADLIVMIVLFLSALVAIVSGIDAINENVIDPEESGFGESRKIFFNILLDDRAGLGQAYNILDQLLVEIEQYSIMSIAPTSGSPASAPLFTAVIVVLSIISIDDGVIG